MGWWWGGGVVAHKILVSAPVPLELILTGFDWVGAGPWGFGIWDGASQNKYAANYYGWFNFSTELPVNVMYSLFSP